MIKTHVFFNSFGTVQLRWSDYKEPTYTDQKAFGSCAGLTGAAKSHLARGQPRFPSRNVALEPDPPATRAALSARFKPRRFASVKPLNMRRLLGNWELYLCQMHLLNQDF